MVRHDVFQGVVVVLLCFLLGSLAQRRLDESPVDGGRSAPQETSRPVIGVLSLELSPTIQKFVGQHHSYIAASYVKYIEGAGARVAPIFIGQEPEYYRQMVNNVNGLLLPGGATYFDEKSGFFAAGKELYRLAREVNEAGVHFPVLGICLGMELLLVAAAGTDFRSKCSSYEPRPLDFLPGSKRDSRLFGRAAPAVIRILEKQNVTVNQHQFCVTQAGMKRERLEQEWRVLTVNKDDPAAVEFVSSYEHSRLPIYGVQFHPEKNIYEWKASKNYPHSESATTAARYFADFLVAEARKNSHSFPPEEEREQLIYRHQPRDTDGRLAWEQLYLFSEPLSGQGGSNSRSSTRQQPSPEPRAGLRDFDV